MARAEMSAAALGSVVRRTVKPVFSAGVPAPVQRRFFEAGARGMPGARVRRETVQIGGVPVLSQTPSEARPGATIVYFHGGGYVTGSARAYLPLTSRLAVAARARVLSVDYRLGPEDPFPAAHDDGASVYRALLEQGQDPATLVVAGDSAGGGLALATVLGAREATLALPTRLLLFSPWLDLRLTELPAGDQEEADAVLSRGGLDRWADDYAGVHPREDPRISPGLARDLSGLPPTLIQYDADEILAGDSVRFTARARSVGAPVELTPFHGLWHDFQLFTLLPQARRALSLAGAFAAGD